MVERLVVSNAFSVSMLADYSKATVSFIKLGLKEAKDLVQLANKEGRLLSIVGHEGTAKLLSEILGVDIKPNRVFYVLNPSDYLLVASIGVRLPEGKVLSYDELREIADKISWYLVKIERYFF